MVACGRPGWRGSTGTPAGVLVLVPLTYEYLAQHRFDPELMGRDIFALALVPSGLFSYLVHLGRFGSPLVLVDAANLRGWKLLPPWEVLGNFFSQPLVIHGPEHSMLDLGFTILFLVLVVASWRLLRPSYALFASVLFVATVCSGTLVSLMRHGLTLFPAFMVLAVAGRYPPFNWLYLFAASFMAEVFMAMFALWYWVA